MADELRDENWHLEVDEDIGALWLAVEQIQETLVQIRGSLTGIRVWDECEPNLEFPVEDEDEDDGFVGELSDETD